MRRTLFLATLLLSVSAAAQTTIDITSQAPAATVCSYPTDHVATGGTPGHLAARLTGTPSGAGCTVGGSGILPVTFGPASPLAPNIVSLGGGTATQTFTIQPLNAVSCTAAIATTVGLGTGTLTNGSSVCNGLANCASATALSIPASFTNTSQSATSTYNVTVTCNAAIGANPASAVSNATVNQAVLGGGGGGGGTCSTVIPSSTSGITSFTQQGGTQDVDYFGNGHIIVDVTSFDALFRAPWPGNYSTTASVTLPTNRYISAKFHVPAGYMAGFTGTGLYGDYSVNNSQFSATISMSLSTTCGDFANPATNPSSSVVPGCWKNKAIVNGYVQWRKDTTCILHDNTDYYFNFINADVSAVQALSGNTAGGTASSTKNANCGSSCTDPIANNPGSWPGYIFP